MERTSTVSTKLALALLALLTVLNVYRAATQPVTPDEAWNYDRYIGVPWKESLSRFDLKNHVLNTLLVRISTARIHLTEFSLRLPSLLAGLFYVWAVWRLARRTLGDGPGFLAVVALLTLNPAIVDALCEARGYGMALAAWMWALELMLECLEEFSPRKLNLAAICLGLSITGCLAFIAPALALIAGFTWLCQRPVARDLYLPILVTMFVLLAIPLNRGSVSDFTQGSNSLRESIGWITSLSFGGLPLNPKVLAAVARTCIIVFLICGGAAILRGRMHGRPHWLLVLCVVTASGAAVIQYLAHRYMDSKYPLGGFIYAVPILTLIGVLLLRPWPRVALACAALLAATYIVQLRPGPYPEGRDVAGARDAAKALRADAMRRTVRIGASVPLEPVFNYYRTRYRQGNWERIERKPPEAYYDYYVLSGADLDLIARKRLRIIFQDGKIAVARP